MVKRMISTIGWANICPKQDTSPLFCHQIGILPKHRINVCRFFICGIVWNTTTTMGVLKDPENMRDAFDLHHWGFGGHGLGAKQAAQCQMILSGAWSEFISLPLPTALVALGLENVNTDITDELLGPSPQPGMGLYLTGTLDNLAKANTNVEQWLDDQSIPWHYMSVVGANHVQYQDESGWWDGFNDGTATMNRSYQHEHALNHILPYLDLMLKGEHEQWL